MIFKDNSTVFNLKADKGNKVVIFDKNGFVLWKDKNYFREICTVHKDSEESFILDFKELWDPRFW